MKPHRFLFSAITIVGSAVLASASAAAPAALSSASALAPSQEEATQDSSECQCTCADCIAKHGAKAEVASVKAQDSTLPELGPDVEAEVAKVLAMNLDAVDQLLLDVTNGEADDAPAESAGESDEPEGERGYMGISLGGGMDGEGAVVGSVTPGSPADKAGLRVGDVIVVAEEFPIESAEDLISALIDLKVGDTASLELERGDKEWAVDIVLGPQIEPEQIIEELVEVGEEIELPEDIQALGALRALGYSSGSASAESASADAEKEVIEEVIEVEEEVELPREVRVLRELGYGSDPTSDDDEEKEVRVQLMIAGDRDVKLPEGLSEELEARIRRLVEERVRESGGGAPGAAREIRVFEFEADEEESEGDDRRTLRWITRDRDGEASDDRRVVEERVERRIRTRQPQPAREARPTREARPRRQARRGLGRARSRGRQRGRADDRGYIEIETRRERRPAPESDLRERINELEDEVAELSRMLSRIRAELDRRNPR